MTAMTLREPELQALLYQSCPLYRHMGLTVESARDGTYRCRVPMEARNSNHLGTIHAALQWGAAEVLGGLVALTSFELQQFAHIFLAVKSATIEFARPARTAIFAEASIGLAERERIKAVVTAGQEASFTLDIAIRSESGETVATMNAAYVARPRRAAVQNAAPLSMSPPP